MHDRSVTLVATRVLLHCGARGSAAETVGVTARPLAAAWSSAHRTPVVDEMQVATVGGDAVGTWRRSAAA